MKRYPFLLSALFLFLLLLSPVSLFAQEVSGAYRLYTFDGDNALDDFGYSVSGAGDVNGDGYDDVIVGAPRALSSKGSARVISGEDGSTLYTFNGDNVGDLFGISVSGIGDLNGDGYDEVIVGAPDNNSGTGSARVFSGVDGSILHTFNGDNALDKFGISVSGAGDVNGDGFDDVIVGAQFDDNNGNDSGSARVFSGVDGSTLYTFNGDSADIYFGGSVSGAGDVNGDGFADVIVGAANDDNNGNNSGSARVFSGVDGTILYTFNGDSADDKFGTSVSGAGDVNGDGYADVIVGSGFVDGGFGGEPPTAGKAYVFVDECPSDANKGLSGACGCGVADTDSDSDGTADCNDVCSADPLKTEAGQCGCGVADTDSDGDGTADCNDVCSADPNKIVIGQCGCGFPDVDLNSDGLLDCFEDPNATPPIPDVPETPEEVVSLADDAKDLVRAMKGKKKSKEAVAALKENLDAISQVIASAVENGVLADEKSRRLVRRLGRKMDRLQVGRPGGPFWRNKKQAFFRALQRLNRALAQ